MNRLTRHRLIVLGVVAAAALPFGYVRIFEHPSNERDWSPDQRVLQRAKIAGDAVTIENLRNFSYKTSTDFAEKYETRSYDLRKLDSVWFVVERFGDTPGIAHTLVSFGFGDEYVSVSVEIRKERGETYSPLRGLLRQYELMYVIADERDVVGLRTNFRRDPVYLYPVSATPERMRIMFVGMLERANKLAAEPEFYNSLTNNCTTNIVGHVNTIAPRAIPFSYKVILPAYSDRLAYDLGLIPANQPFETIRAAHRIDALAQQRPLGPDYSRLVRRKKAP
jgi:Domain of unknown function (DUF4105)